MADFMLKISPQVLLGPDVVNRVAAMVRKHATRALLVADPLLSEGKEAARIGGLLQDGGVSLLSFDEIPPFSGSSVADALAELANGSRAQAIIALGGMKVAAIARAAAAAAGSGKSVDDIMDRGLAEASVPVFIVPSALRDHYMLSDRFSITDSRSRVPRMVRAPEDTVKGVIIDPNLLSGAAGKLSASIVLDSLLAAIEAYLSNRASFFSDTILEAAIRDLASAAERLRAGEDVSAAAGLVAQGAMLSAMGAHASSLGLGTSIAGAIGAKYRVAKAWLSPVLLPYILEEGLKSRVEKIARVAALLGEDIEALKATEAGAKAVEWARRLLGALKLPTRLKDFELQLDKMVEVAGIVREMETSSYLPRVLSVEDIYDVIKQAF